MADGEEDYSSLPLTDRWVHKVRGTRDPTGRRLHKCNEPKAGGEGYLLEATSGRTKGRC